MSFHCGVHVAAEARCRREAHGGDTSVAADRHSECRSIVGCMLLLIREADRLAHGGDTSVAVDNHGERSPVVGHVCC